MGEGGKKKKKGVNRSEKEKGVRELLLGIGNMKRQVDTNWRERAPAGWLFK